MRGLLSSARVREALDKGAERFNWAERIQRNGQRRGSIVTGVGVAVGNFSGGTLGFDGLMTLRPDGRLYIQQGIGNLGTLSVFDTARAGAEVVDITWGNTSKPLPFSIVQGGSLTTHTMTRANYAAGMALSRSCRRSPRPIWVGARTITRWRASASIGGATGGGASRSRRPPSGRSRWGGV